jgi:hypothetical protein
MRARPRDRVQAFENPRSAVELESDVEKGTKFNIIIRENWCKGGRSMSKKNFRIMIVEDEKSFLLL